ncbi:S8 family serine peptidase [Nonlabens tegetincola]
MSAVLLGGVGPVNAVALPENERSSALWYADGLRFDELQAQGATGEGVKIAVIDAALNPDVAELAGANITVKGSYCAFPDTGTPVPAVSDDVARAGHGTSVVAMLVGNGTSADGGPGTRGIVPDAEVWFYSTGLPNESAGDDGGVKCENYDGARGEFYDTDLPSDSPDYFLGRADSYAAWNAVRDGADIVVYSRVDGDSIGWTSALQTALRAGVPIVAGTPNPDGDITAQTRLNYPYKLNGVVAVSGLDNEGNILSGGGDRLDPMFGEAQGSSNLGFLSAGSELLVPSSAEAWGPSLGYGTSLATPLVAGVIALGLEEFPEATANQVLQAMMRTTGPNGLHEPEWVDRKKGYGLANPMSLLNVDPATYPDENPLFVESADDPRCIQAEEPAPTSMDLCRWSIGPTFEEVWPSGTSEEIGPKEPSPEATAEWPAWATVAIVLLVVGVAGTAIIVPIAVSRSRRGKTQQAQQRV